MFCFISSMPFRRCFHAVKCGWKIQSYPLGPPVSAPLSSPSFFSRVLSPAATKYRLTMELCGALPWRRRRGRGGLDELPASRRPLRTCAGELPRRAATARGLGVLPRRPTTERLRPSRDFLLAFVLSLLHLPLTRPSRLAHLFLLSNLDLDAGWLVRSWILQLQACFELATHGSSEQGRETHGISAAARRSAAAGGFCAALCVYASASEAAA